jgi:ubiquinone/menaquinone biosynthesis C-methylase UbiE
VLLRRALAHQLARPSGLPGRFMGRTLDRVNSRVNQIALDQLSLDPGDRLLDVGFGGGLLMREALARVPGIFVTGIDVSHPMLARAEKLFRDGIRSGRVEIREADVAAIPYADGRFDKAAAINTMHFWSRPGLGLSELRRVLVPGGLLVIAVRPRDFLERIRFTKYGYVAYDTAELERLLRTAGFESIGIDEYADRDMGSVHAMARRPRV